MSEIKVEKIVDARGMLCPMPALLAVRALETVNPSGVIKVIADCPEARENVPRIVESQGHRVVEIKEEKDTFIVVIKKKA